MITEMALNYKDVTESSSSVDGSACLERFPLVHEVADLPHERLMARDNGIGSVARSS